jgi:hypothetical protein
MHGFWHCQTVTPIENSKQNPARQAQRLIRQANPARQGKPLQQTQQAKQTQHPGKASQKQ